MSARPSRPRWIGAAETPDFEVDRLRRIELDQLQPRFSQLRSVELLDVQAERIDAANSDWKGAHLRRVTFSDARLTGIDLAEGQLEEVTFKGCRLDYANFRHSRIGQVSFKDCLLTGADFQGATLDATLFSGCELIDADFSKAKLSLVDLRGSKLALAGSVLLGGAIIDSLQLMELAPVLAHELGITVEDT